MSPNALLIAVITLGLAHAAGADMAGEGSLRSETYTSAAELFAVEGQRRLNMFCIGDGAPAIVFIAGAWGNTMVWRRVQGPASQMSRACSYDRAGLGFSDPATRPSTALNTVDDLDKLLDAAGVAKPVVLVGHSAGGLYALLFAATHRNRVAGLVLVDPSDTEANARLAGHWSSEFAEQVRQQTLQNHQALRHCVDLAREGALTPQNSDPYCLMKESEPMLKTELDRQHVRLQTKEAILSEMLSLDEPVEDQLSLDGLQFRAAMKNRSLGKLPLILLRHGTRTKHPALPQEIFDKNEAVFLAGYERMAAYSSIGAVRTVPDCGHNIQLEQPAAVIAAIQEIVTAARVSRQAVPSQGESHEQVLSKNDMDSRVTGSRDSGRRCGSNAYRADTQPARRGVPGCLQPR